MVGASQGMSGVGSVEMGGFCWGGVEGVVTERTGPVGFAPTGNLVGVGDGGGGGIAAGVFEINCDGDDEGD